jgi:hypothetical protein
MLCSALLLSVLSGVCSVFAVNKTPGMMNQETLGRCGFSIWLRLEGFAFSTKQESGSSDQPDADIE